MAFRGFESDGPEFLRDPLARFRALDEAFEAERTLFAGRAPQRLAAVNLVTTPGDPVELATAVRRIADRFEARVGFGMAAPPLVPMVIGAIVLRHGDEADWLIDEVKRVRSIMRRVGFRWSVRHELVAIIALRVQTRGPIADAQIERMHAIYEAMKVNHWWLTGPDDFPACALLSGRPGSPTQLADRAHAIYELLHRDHDLTRGDPLQFVSNMLALVDAEPGDLAQRYAALLGELERHGYKIRFDRYDDVALLCFLPRSSESVVATVIEYERALRQQQKWYEHSLSFSLAVNLAFVHVVGNDPQLGPLADVKAILDIYWLLEQQS